MRAHASWMFAAMIALGSTAAYAAPSKPSKDSAQGGLTANASVSQQAVYDSNPLRLPSGEETLFGSTTTSEFTLNYKTPITTLNSVSTINANYFDDNAFNSIDLFQELSASRSNQRFTATLGVALAYDTTRTSEITNFAQNLPSVRSRKLTLAPEVEFRPSTRERWKISSSARDTDYDNTAFIDYRLYTLTPSYEYRLTPQYSVHVDVRAQRYEATQGTENISDSIGPLIGFNSRFNRGLSAGAAMGAVHVNKYGAGVTGERDLWNYVFRGNLTYQQENNTWDVVATRAREPFGNGTETLLDTFILRQHHQWNPHLRLEAEGKYQSADYSGINPGVNLDHSLSIGGGAYYALTGSSELSGSYRYRDERLTNINGAIAQHVVMMNVTYHPSL